MNRRGFENDPAIIRPPFLRGLFQRHFAQMMDPRPFDRLLHAGLVFDDDRQGGGSRTTAADVPIELLEPYMLTEEKNILKYLLQNAPFWFDESVITELKLLRTVHPELDPFCRILNRGLWTDLVERRAAMEKIFKAVFINV